MHSRPPGDFLNDQTSTSVLNETWHGRGKLSSNLGRRPGQYFDLDQTSRPPTRYRDRNIRGTHDPKDLGPACRV